MIRMGFHQRVTAKAKSIEQTALASGGKSRETGEKMTELSGLGPNYLGRIAREKLLDVTTRVLVNLGFMPVLLDLDNGEILVPPLNSRTETEPYSTMFKNLQEESGPIGRIEVERFK